MTMYEETVGDSLYMYCMTVVTDGKLISLLQGLSASSNFPSCFYRTHFNPKLKWTLVLYSCHYTSPDISKTLKSWSTWPATIKLSFGLIRKLSRSSASSWCAQVKGTEKNNYVWWETNKTIFLSWQLSIKCNAKHVFVHLAQSSQVFVHGTTNFWGKKDSLFPETGGPKYP